MGTPLRMNERSARTNANGTTGRMLGLTIVSTPPRYATTKTTMLAFALRGLVASGLKIIVTPFLQ